jgi:hypothetical protein
VEGHEQVPLASLVPWSCIIWLRAAGKEKLADAEPNSSHLLVTRLAFRVCLPPLLSPWSSEKLKTYMSKRPLVYCETSLAALLTLQYLLQNPPLHCCSTTPPPHHHTVVAQNTSQDA